MQIDVITFLKFALYAYNRYDVNMQFVYVFVNSVTDPLKLMNVRRSCLEEIIYFAA